MSTAIWQTFHVMYCYNLYSVRAHMHASVLIVTRRDGVTLGLVVGGMNITEHFAERQVAMLLVGHRVLNEWSLQTGTRARRCGHRLITSAGLKRQN